MLKYILSLITIPLIYSQNPCDNCLTAITNIYFLFFFYNIKIFKMLKI